jgi:hypothetical protein
MISRRSLAASYLYGVRREQSPPNVQVELITAKEIWGQIPPRDLAWRPPERLLRNLAALLPADESAV